MGIDSTDRELPCWLNADPAAFETFYRRHVDRVVRYTTRSRARIQESLAECVDQPGRRS